MPNMTLSIPHQLTRHEAKRRIQDEIAKLRHRHGSVVSHLHETWSNDTLEFSVAALGQAVSGRMLIDDHAVHLIVELPWLLSMLAKGIKPRIEQEVRHLLASPTHPAPV